MTPVEFHFVLPTGIPLANSTVEIQLANSTITDSQAGVVLPRLIAVQTDLLGKAIVNLWPSTTLYYVTVMDSASEAGLSYKFIVPEVSQGTTVRLQDIVVNNAPTSVTWDNAAMLSILNAKASANASAIAAATSVASIPLLISSKLSASDLKTINGQVIYGTGNIFISSNNAVTGNVDGGDPTTVYDVGVTIDGGTP